MIHSRAVWGAKHGTGPKGPAVRSRVIVHHFWRPDVGRVKPAREHEVLRSVEHHHAVINGWRRIGYNLIVFDSGRAYVGCGLTTVGAHAAGQNTAGFGLCFPINGDARGPSEDAWEAAAQAVKDLQDDGVLARTLSVEGHRDWSAKSCPGVHVYPHRNRLIAPAPPPQEDDDMSFLGLKQGDTGARVRYLQARLGTILGNDVRAAIDAADGPSVYGQATAKAVGDATGKPPVSEVGPWDANRLDVALITSQR